MNDIQPTFAFPTREEMAGRIERLRHAMQSAGVACAICISTDNVYYLTNFANYVHERPFILVVTEQGPVRFLMPKLERFHVEARAIGDIDLVDYIEFPAPEGQRWNDILRAMIPSSGQIAIESTCPMFLARELGDRAVIADLVDDQRMVKSAFELGRIQYASDLASRTFNTFLATAKVGTSLAAANADIAGKVMGNLLSEEPKLNLFATKINFGFQPPSVSWDPHNFTDISMALEHGGPNVALFNGVMNGYATEIERTFFLGNVPEAAKRPFDVMLKARRAALEAIKPGALMSEIDRQANAVFRSAGYAQNLLHRAGHGIGVTGHEGPFFAEGYDRIIEPGMVFTIEPGVYIKGIGGFRHSDTLRVDDAGAVLMTSGPIDLEDLLIPA